MDDEIGDSEEDEGEEDDLDNKADVVKQEGCSRDEVMHVGKNGL